jgi:hypothetical protein
MFVAVDRDGSVFRYATPPALESSGCFFSNTEEGEYIGKVHTSYAGQFWPEMACPFVLEPLAAPEPATRDCVAGGDLKTGAGKVALSHLPWGGLIEVGKVVDYGAAKYARGNWRQPPSPEYAHKYISAALRHIAEAASTADPGSAVDAESGLSHLAHAACSLLFIIDCHKKQ